MYRENAEKLLNFIDRSPSAFHVIANMKAELEEAGFKELKEKDRWHLEKGGKYFVTRNLSSIIAFMKRILNPLTSWQVTVTHQASKSRKILK